MIMLLKFHSIFCLKIRIFFFHYFGRRFMVEENRFLFENYKLEQDLSPFQKKIDKVLYLFKFNHPLLFFSSSFSYFSSLRLFGLLSSSLLLFPQRFRWHVLHLLQMFVEFGNLHGTSNYILQISNPQGSPVLITLAITGYKC